VMGSVDDFEKDWVSGSAARAVEGYDMRYYAA